MRAVLLVLVFASADDQADLAKYTKDLKSKDTKVRLKAAQRLADLGEPASGPLCDAMLDKDLKVATAALKSLEKAAPKLHEPLNRLALYPDYTNQKRALVALADLGEKGRPAYSLVFARYKAYGMYQLQEGFTGAQRKDIGERYWTALKAICEEGKLVELHKYRGDLVWLVTWAGDKEERRKELLPLIKRNLAEETPGIYHIRLAGDYGKLSQDLLPLLKKLDFHKSDIIRTEAAKAVKMIEGK